MKKLLFLIFIAVTIYAQPEIQYYYYNNMNSNGELDLSTLTNPARWTDVTMPLTPYQSGYVYLPTKIMKTPHSDSLDMTMSCDSFYIEWEIGGGYTIGSQRVFGLGNSYVIYNPNGGFTLDITFKNDGVYYPIYQQLSPSADTLKKTIKVLWHKSDSVLTTYKDGVLQFTYTGVTLKTTLLGSTLASMVVNNITIYNQPVSDYTYTTAGTTNSGKLSFWKITFKRNRYKYVWDMNNAEPLFIHPTVYHDDSLINPYYTFEYSDRPSTNGLILMNGATTNIDTLDGTFIYGSLKSNYRDCYLTTPELSGWSPDYGIQSEAFGGEPLVIDDTLYIGGNFNIGNGTSKTRTGYDSAKSTVRYNSSTNKWEQLGFGLTTSTGTSGCMHIGAYGDSIIATGYDVTATGVGTINGVSIRRAGQSNWAAMQSGLGATGVGFGGGEGYGKYMLGGVFTKAGGAYGNYIQIWNGVSWDSARGGLNNVAYAIYAYSWNGENGWLVGGAFTSFTQGGVTTPCSGLAFFSNDSLKWKKFYNMQTVGSPNTVFNILIDGDWIYPVGDYVQMDTATSRGICRFRISTGVQDIGTGIKSVVNAEAITSIAKIGNIIYIAGSFTFFNNFMSRNIAAFNVSTGYLKDMGYGMPMRPEGLCKYYNPSIASDTVLVTAGDQLVVNGKIQRIVSFYNPALNP